MCSRYKPCALYRKIAHKSGHGLVNRNWQATELRQACPDALIPRTAWLYSDLATICKTMLRLCAERPQMRVLSPNRNANLCRRLRSNSANSYGSKFVPGIYHFTNEGGVVGTILRSYR